MSARALTDARPASPSDTLALCAVAFSLAMFNGHPRWLSNAAVCAVASLLILVSSSARSRDPRVCDNRLDWLGWLLAGLTVAASVSTLFNASALTAINLVLGYVIPLLLYFASRDARLAVAGIRLVVLALSAGLLLRFGIGLATFVTTFGLPSNPIEVFFMRDAVQASAYVDATFGNTGNTASLIAVVLPVLLASLARLGFAWPGRVFIVVTVVVLLANALVTGSRGVLAFALLSAALVVALFVRWRSIALSACVALASAAWWSDALLGDADLSGLFDYLTLAGATDHSAIERAESISIGLETVRENPMGVGPNRSIEVNAYSVPHQFAVNQASDIGILAFALWGLITVTVTLRFSADAAATLRGTGVPSVVFSLTAAIWLLYGMTLNMATTAGTCISWIGFFAMCAGMANNKSLRGPPAPPSPAVESVPEHTDVSMYRPP
jgi:hypothetical protein